MTLERVVSASGTIDHLESGHWELQHHLVHVRGPIGELHADSQGAGDRG
jgi:hypothetical protein